MIAVVTLASVVGHRRLTALISRAVDRGTLPPTLLFVGPAGVGKWRVARATAQALNCQEPVGAGRPGGAGGSGGAGGAGLPRRSSLDDARAKAGGEEWPIDACGRCRACDRIDRAVHVDVIGLEPDEKASIKIDVVREVLMQAGYRPFEGRRRVVLIREADTLEPQSQNALLKSLEEPPPGTMFILTTALPGALLPTVRSRCMQLRFGRLTPLEVADVLARDHGYERAQAEALAALAGGSVGDALGLASTDISMLRDLALGLIQRAARTTDVRSRLDAAGSIVTVRPKVDRPRGEVAMILRMTASLLRDLEALNAGADMAVLANRAVTDALSPLARAFAGDRARTAFAAVVRALDALQRNAGQKLVAEWLAVNL
jgi:DNA polymerase-3 subunit delta'